METPQTIGPTILAGAWATQTEVTHLVALHSNEPWFQDKFPEIRTTKKSICVIDVGKGLLIFSSAIHVMVECCWTFIDPLRTWPDLTGLSRTWPALAGLASHGWTWLAML